MAKESTKPVTVCFDDERLAELEAIAAREDRSLAAQIRHLVAQALERHRNSPAAAA
jgi:hypothetical protein